MSLDQISIYDIQCHGVGALGLVLLPVGDDAEGVAGTGAGLGCSNSSVGDMRSLKGLRAPRTPIRGPDGSPIIGLEIGRPETPWPDAVGGALRLARVDIWSAVNGEMDNGDVPGWVRGLSLRARNGLLETEPGIEPGMVLGTEKAGDDCG